MLDQAIVNSRILLKCKLINTNRDRRITGGECNKTIAHYLAQPFLRERFTCKFIRTELKLAIAHLINEDRENVQDEEMSPILEKKVRCQICKRKRDRKTRIICLSCKRAMCDEHRTFHCVDCVLE